MQHVSLSRAIRDVLFAAPLLTSASFAFAQDATAPDDTTKTLDRIEVTGSNIPRTDTETASPVQVITRQEIDRTGKTTVGEYLQTLTAGGAGTIPKSFGNGFSAGGSGVSLRGLGAASTLVLLNGRRIAPYGLADDGQKIYTDLSVIPLETVERVEVLKDGASSIYGSDAIAGVVNIILRKEFTGATVKGSYGISGDGDGAEKKGSLTAGWGSLAEDGYNFFFNVEGSKTDGIMVSDRGNRKWIGTGDSRPWGYDIGGARLNGFLGGAITGGGTVGRASPVGAIGLPNADGDYIFQSLPGCAQFSNVTPQDPGGGCLYDAAKLFRSLTPKEQYINLFARGTFVISDNAELYSEFSYSKKKSEFSNAPSGVSGAWGFPSGAINADDGVGAVVLGANHPDNINPVTGLPNGIPARLRYSAFDVGPRIGRGENEFTRFLVGLKGTTGAWDYDLGYLHSQTSLFNDRQGELSYSRVRQVLTDPNSPVGYWRIGINSGLNSQALYEYISPKSYQTASTKLDIVDAKMSRSLMDLRGGALGLGLGAEYRRTVGELNAQTGTETGDIIGRGYSAYSGKEEVASAYAELAAPVLESLELTGAIRFDSYKGGENSTTPKVGIKWKPADWIALRATYAEGFRAPSAAESGKGGTAGFSNASDPVRCPDGENPAPGGTDIDCQGVPVSLITRPNPDLKPEKAKSYTVGLVLAPTSSTSLTLDAFKLERTDEILGGDSDAAIRANGPNVIRGDNDLPGIPHSGTLLAVITPYINADSTTVRGFDFDIEQRFDLDTAGTLKLDLQWTRVNSFERNIGGTRQELSGTHGDCNVTNCIGTPKDRVNFGTTWDIGTFTLSGIVNYRGKLENKNFKGAPCRVKFADGTDAPRGCELESFYTIDLSGGWSPTDDWEVFGSIANVTDRIAPLDPLTYGAVNYNPLDFSGAIGRYYTVGVKYKFD